MELPGLGEGVLTDAGVQGEHDFVGGAGIQLGDDALHFGQFVHEVALGVQAAGGVDDEHIHMAGAGGFQSVVGDGGRVGAVGLGDDGDGVAFAPDLELLDGGGAEGVARGQQDAVAVALKSMGELADGGGLADAVDADHQNDEGAAGFRNVFQGGFRVAQQGGQFLFEGLQQGVGIGELLARNLGGEALDNRVRRLYADIGGEQLGLDVLQQFVVDPLGPENESGQAVHQTVAGLGQTVAKAAEQAFGGGLRFWNRLVFFGGF